MRVKLNRKLDTQVQMGPLIDCVFLLLIFFIVIAVTKKSIKELGIQLPAPGAAVSEIKPREKDLVLRLTGEGQVYVGDRQVLKQGILDAIREAYQRDPDTKVRFEIDKRAQFQHLFPIMDQLKHYGLTDWSFRVHMEE
jgi:biopolymer transport protein ExbD